MSTTGLLLQPTAAKFTSSKLRKVYDDKLMNDGSLFIWDPRHSLGAFSGKPTNAQSIGNVARNQLAKIISASDPSAASLQAIFRYYQANNPTTDAAATQVKMERTAKLGLHIAVSQTVWNVSSFALFRVPAAVKTYIDGVIPSTGTGNLIYISKWARRTKAQVAVGSGLETPTISYLATSSNGFWNDCGGGVNAFGTGAGSIKSPTGFSSLAAYFTAMASSAWQSSEDTTRYPEIGLVQPGAYQSFNVNKAPSEIVYRINICDLTLAGMDWATYKALDYAEYVAQCETAGGDFYETSGWTDPATLCP